MTYIIKQGCSAIEYYTNLHRLYERARELSIEIYITGEERIPSDESIKGIERPLIHFYKVQLENQTSEEEDKMATQLKEQITLNPLYAYELILPVNAANPDRPTEAELEEARMFIPYHKNDFLTAVRLSGLEYNPDAGEAEKQALYDFIRPDNRYFGFGSAEIEDIELAAATSQINPIHYRELIKREVTMHPSIRRLVPEDNVRTLTMKLTQKNIDKAVTAFTKSQESFTKAYDRNFNLHGTILKFFREAIENVETSTAASFLSSREWHLVIPSITDSYGNAKAPFNLDEMHQKFTQLELEPLETVHTFLQRFKEYIVNIQMVEEKTGDIPDKINHEDMLRSCFYTEEEWKQHHPNRRRVIGQITIVTRLLTAISKSRLQRVQWDFNTQVAKPQDRTITSLIERMITGESSLEVGEQVLTTVSSVTAVQKNGTKFCAYHSHGNQKANHETKDCKAINGGFAIPDPKGGQWYVNKDNNQHFKSKETGGVGEKRKRSDNDSDAKDNKKSSKECTKCLKLNKEGASIPESVIKSHNAGDCRVNAKKYNSDKNKEKTDTKSDGKPTWDKSFKTLMTKVNQISLAMKSKDKSKNGRKPKEDDGEEEEEET